MKIKNGYTLIENNEEFFVKSPTGNIIPSIHLSKISSFLWKEATKSNISSSDMLNLLLKEFEISTVLALGEIDTFIKILKENEILE